MDTTKIIVSYLDLNESEIQTAIKSAKINLVTHPFQFSKKSMFNDYGYTFLIFADSEDKKIEWENHILEFIRTHRDEEIEGDFYTFMCGLKSQDDFLSEQIDDGNNHKLKNFTIFTRLFTFEF